MRYLITNDDGINATGLKILAKIAKNFGDVICVAPLTEQSAKSHGLNIRTTYSVEQVADIIPGVKSYAVDSTPADCVRVAHYYLNIDYDIVLSGINNGYNLGEDIMYSGTLGAAEEGVLLGKKGIAFSAARNKFEGLEEALCNIFQYINNEKLINKSYLLNINIPNNFNSIKITKQGKTNFRTYYRQISDKVVSPEGTPDNSRQYDDINSDVITIDNNCISITPLIIDRTDYKIFSNK